jgi:glutamyl-tRNA reductase
MKYDDPSELQQKLHELKERFQLQELFYLSTCNRVLYFFKSTDQLSATFQYHFFRHINASVTAERISESVIAHEGEAALSHLCHVAASVDSMVIGEREILRQLRTSYDQCQQWGLTGDDLRIAMELAVRTAKDVYSNTKIGEKSISIASLAALQLRNSGLSKDARILMIGAGQTNMLISKFLIKYGYTNVDVFNRTLEKATYLATQLGGDAYRLTDLATYDKGFDAIIICTGATKPVLTDELYTQLLQGDTSRKLVIDIAIPNNTDKRIVDEHEVKYIEVESLRHHAKENLAFRKAEVHRATAIVDQHLIEFPQIYQSRQLEKAMKTVPDAIKAVKNMALNDVFKSEVEALDEDSRELLERVISYMEKKCIGIPMRAARKAMS